MAVTDRVTEIVSPLLGSLGVDLIDVEHASGRLRVTVDQQGGIDSGVLTAATRAVSRALDEHDPVPGRYTLEVSSPGLERPLRTREHFERAIGEEVALRLVAGVEGDRRVRGELRSVDGDAVVVSVGSDDGERLDRRIALDEIDRARTVFEWGPAPKPGKGPNNTRKSKKQKRSESATAAEKQSTKADPTTSATAPRDGDTSAQSARDASVGESDSTTSHDDETTRAS
jgi:ribosome maturation factor RimP